MRLLMDSLVSMSQTMKNFFRRPTTVNFPYEKRERSERYRTSFALRHDEEGDELCIGCVACERICPSQVITVRKGGKRESSVTGKKRAYADDLTLDMNACIFCELCVQVCPTDALVMLRVQDEPQYSREALFLTMNKLYENEKREQSWSTGNKLMEMQNPKRGEPPPEKKKAAPAKDESTPAKDENAAAPKEEKAISAKAAETSPAQEDKSSSAKAEETASPKQENTPAKERDESTPASDSDKGGAS